MSLLFDLDVKCGNCGFKGAYYTSSLVSHLQSYMCCPFCGYCEEDEGAELTTHSGSGTYFYQYAKSTIRFHSFGASRKNPSEFKEWVAQNEPQLERAWFTQKNEDGTWEKIFLIGQPYKGEITHSDQEGTYREVLGGAPGQLTIG